ncbi:MAG: ParA family protein [Candidatus Heimdallarchaeota archaeon]
MVAARRITINSYKGGTGKTIFTANTGTFAATECQLRTLLIDADWQAGTLGPYFLPEDTVQTAKTFSDFLLWLASTYREAHQDKDARSAYLSKINTDSAFFTPMVDELDACVLPTEYANLDIIPIRGITSNDRAHLGNLSEKFWVPNALITLRRLLTELGKQRQYDLIVMDTAPGFTYPSLTAMVVAHTSVIVATPDRINIRETLRALRNADDPLRRLFEIQPAPHAPLPIRTVLNGYVATSKIASANLAQWTADFNALAPVIGVLPGDLEILGGDLMIPNIRQEKPEHPWAQELAKVMRELLKLLKL